MNCREFTEFLHEYLFDNLPAAERAVPTRGTFGDGAPRWHGA